MQNPSIYNLYTCSNTVYRRQNFKRFYEHYCTKINYNALFFTSYWAVEKWKSKVRDYSQRWLVPIHPGKYGVRLQKCGWTKLSSSGNRQGKSLKSYSF